MQWRLCGAFIILYVYDNLNAIIGPTIGNLVNKQDIPRVVLLII